MEAAVYHANRDIRIDDIAEPTAEQGGVVIEVAQVGICGTDLLEYENGPIFLRPGVVLGHEFSGTVAEVGSGVDRWKVGDQVVVAPMDYCGRCDYCRQGLYSICDEMAGVGFHMNGGLSRFTAVPEKLLFPVPEEVTLAEAALTEPIVVGFHGVRRARLSIGESVLVVGAGSVGLAVAQCAAVAGASMIIVSEPSAARREAANALGATHVIDPSHQDLALAVEEITQGRGVDVAFDAAGAQGGMDAALASLRKRGRVVTLATWHSPATVEMNYQVVREIEWLFAFGYEMVTEFPAVLNLLATGRINAMKMISEQIGLHEFVPAMRDMSARRDENVKVLVNVGD